MIALMIVLRSQLRLRVSHFDELIVIELMDFSVFIHLPRINMDIGLNLNPPQLRVELTRHRFDDRAQFSDHETSTIFNEPREIVPKAQRSTIKCDTNCLNLLSAFSLYKRPSRVQSIQWHVNDLDLTKKKTV